MRERTKAFESFEHYTRELQARIIGGLGAVEPAAFTLKDWVRPEGGGGRMAFVRGDVLEKGAVLVSSVHGASSPLSGKPFRAAGLSLILHPKSPHAPTVHLNVRAFEEPDDGWWGGGVDLTPMGVRHEEDVAAFHARLADAFGPRYPDAKRAADDYFFVPHRGRPRGAGGVFFDHVREGGEDLVRTTGDLFLDLYLPILARRGRQPFDEPERAAQLRDRGVYVEFNLLHDRGTRFGLQSGGNPEAILSSLPPLASW